MENRFNLIDEPWIPVVDHGRVSLREVFANREFRALGGNPVQRIALTNLLLAIAQAAATPKDEDAWRAMGADGMAKRCLAYLDKWHDRFYLYGERPFLQMPAVAKAKPQDYGGVAPEVATGNTTVLTHSQVERAPSDGDKAVLLATLMGFALSGKKTDNSVVLTPGYGGKNNDKGKPSTGKPGPSMAHVGLLHNFFTGDSIRTTLWLNLLSIAEVGRMKIYPAGIGVAPWEEMPEGEDCQVAQRLKETLMGRLVPLCRFCLLADEGLHYTEGISHAGYKEGMADPSAAINISGKEPKALWVDPEKRPWRELTSLLGFLGQDRVGGFDCWRIRIGLERARDVTNAFALWSGGLRVSSNAGEQYVSGADDFVSSTIWLSKEHLGETWFFHLKQEMGALETVAKHLYGSAMAYVNDFKGDGKTVAGQTTRLFWQLVERNFQELVDACGEEVRFPDLRLELRRRFTSYANQAYDRYCPNSTARQLDAWAAHRPNNAKYLKGE